jgi:hypothetical protein
MSSYLWPKTTSSAEKGDTNEDSTSADTIETVDTTPVAEPVIDPLPERRRVRMIMNAVNAANKILITSLRVNQMKRKQKILHKDLLKLPLTKVLMLFR